MTGAVRVGIQVIVSQKRPVLEVYQDLRNEFAPPFDIEHRDSTNTKVVGTTQHRFQDISIHLILVNVGGERAERVNFELSGSFRRNDAFEPWPKTFAAVVPQVAPGQSLFLMKVRDHDLEEHVYEDQGNGHSVGKAVGTKTDTLTITMHYDGPDTWLNRILRWPRHLRGLKQFSSSFTFDPAIYHELPPPKYNG